MTAAKKARRREAFDARELYRFVPHAKRDMIRGTQRFRGPAVGGHPFKVRCPNTPTSMRMPHTIPTTTCVHSPTTEPAPACPEAGPRQRNRPMAYEMTTVSGPTDARDL